MYITIALNHTEENVNMCRVVLPEQLNYDRLIISEGFITGDIKGFFFSFLSSGSKNIHL